MWLKSLPQLESANYHELANFRKRRSNFRLASILTWSLPHDFLDILDISNEAVAIKLGMFDFNNKKNRFTL